jgi:2-oxoisovalerate ferredoxin oxidoreductase beta subunit
MSVFYDRFERHAGGEGLKAHSTHYCPGCGHGVVHKFVAEAIEELGIQDRAVAISPVGCAVFLYYYLDVGNVQAAHGRAPAVAIGQKLARPQSIVISYQGDGDLASIGIAEFIQAAQLGVPITVVFVNNATYGMTGGQMAPTSLIGQKTATSPEGRTRLMGEPLKIAELVAQLDGPVYVERVALYDNKQRVKARTAIKKGIQLQVENRGFALIEVLSECPLHLGRTPEEAERWVKEQMVPVFPLGVKKDVTASREPWPAWPAPIFSADLTHELIGAGGAAAPRCCAAFPRERWGTDVALKLAGAGGDGAQTAAMIVTQAAINEGFDATHIPSYGPESRGGTSYADVRIAEKEVLSPAAPHPDILVAFNAPSLAKFAPAVADNGVMIYDRSVMADPPARAGVHVVPIPASAIAAGLGRIMVKNVVMLGALAAAGDIFPEETFLAAIRHALRSKPALLEINERAFAEGARAAREARPQPADGYGVAPCTRAQADGVPCDSPAADCEKCPDALHA